MTLETKVLIVRPEDVQGIPLGNGSPAADVTITAEYDSTIEAGGEVIPAHVRTPLKWDPAVGYWGISLVASDDPAITSGVSPAVIIRIEITPRRSYAATHGRQAIATYTKTIQIVTDDPALIAYGSKPDLNGRRRVVLLEDQPGLWSPIGLTETAPGIWG